MACRPSTWSCAEGVQESGCFKRDWSAQEIALTQRQPKLDEHRQFRLRFNPLRDHSAVGRQSEMIHADDQGWPTGSASMPPTSERSSFSR